MWVSIADQPQAHVTPQVGAWLILNYACNCSCKFCPVAGLGPAFKSLSDIQLAIDRAADSCSRDYIEFSGGEILLHPDLPEIVRYAKYRGFERIHFFTNGIDFSDESVCQKFADLGLNSVMVSVHAATQRTHETLMGGVKGGHNAVWTAIRNLSSVHVNVIVNSVVTTLNLHEIPQIADQCVSLYPAVKQFRVTYPAIEGRMSQNRDLLVSLDRAVEALYPLAVRNMPVEFRFELFPFCILGHQINSAIEWIHCKESVYFEEYCSMRYRRVIGRECVECSHIQLCHGLQEDYVKVFGIPKRHNSVIRDKGVDH